MHSRFDKTASKKKRRKRKRDLESSHMLILPGKRDREKRVK